MLVSSGARRIRSLGVDTGNGIRSDSGKHTIAYWFLNGKDEIRPSTFLKMPATQFVVRGLELDWACAAWSRDLSYNNGRWVYRNFTGTSWKSVNIKENQDYLINSHRVLLTRARQGMVIFVPEGSFSDTTRSPEYYDQSYNYLEGLGLEIPKLNVDNRTCDINGCSRLEGD